jgi:hypothetical protein
MLSFPVAIASYHEAEGLAGFSDFDPVQRCANSIMIQHRNIAGVVPAALSRPWYPTLVDHARS